PPPMVNTKIARWFTRVTASLLLGASLLQPAVAQDAPQERETALQPQETEAAEPIRDETVRAQQLTFSATPRRQRAEWQERLTFGPGDTMDLTIYDRPELTRTNVFVGPDGRISYLQVQ